MKFNFEVIDYAEYFNGILKINDVEYKAIEGKHCIYIPDPGIKIIWSHNGMIEARKDWDLGRNKTGILNGEFSSGKSDFQKDSLKSIISEYFMMKNFYNIGLAPRIGKLIRIKSFNSRYPYGSKYCDVKGRYGYYMQNAKRLKPIKYNVDDILDYLYGKVNFVSDGFIGDLKKTDNNVNGYLIDVRRTIWDMTHYKDEFIDYDKHIERIKVKEDKDLLMKDIRKLTQFPHKQRKDCYQTFYMDGKYHVGSRDTLYRFEKMRVPLDLSGFSVLDLGCNLGSIVTECYLRGARRCMGVDFEKDYIDCARRLAKYNTFDINFQVMDLTKINKCKKEFDSQFKGRKTIVFALSLYKHMKNTLFSLLNSFNWDILYLESNNAPEGYNSPICQEMTAKIARSSNVRNVEMLGMTDDRSPRCLWRVSK